MKCNPLRDYWESVREGVLPRPQRKRDTFKRLLSCALDGTFGPDGGRQLKVTLHLDGRLEIRPQGTRRTEVVHMLDVYRFAIRCRVNAVSRAKAMERRQKKAERLARQRQERAEKRLEKK